MPYVRLPETVHTLYAELLDQVRANDAEALASLKGTFVSKQIRERTYWYLQKSAGAGKRQIYLGAESPELLERMREASSQRASAATDDRRRRELVTMLDAGGMYRESAAVGVVLRVLSEASVFRAGGVLVGTQAFTCIANLLGVRFERESLRTADIDVAHDGTIPLGFNEAPDVALLDRLRAEDASFFAVPGIDARQPSTSFKVRGKDLRVDFLTPAHTKTRGPVYLHHLGVAALPVAGLDYLVASPVDAAVVVASGIRVNVPAPARFAFHKLWLSDVRTAAESAKVRKDLRQASQLFEVLADDRPGDLITAWEQLRARSKMFRGARKALKKLEPQLQKRIGTIISAGED